MSHFLKHSLSRSCVTRIGILGRTSLTDADVHIRQGVRFYGALLYLMVTTVLYSLII